MKAFLLILALVTAASAAHALDIEWVTVGDPGNAPDKTGYGAVAHEFQISKHEITVAQYAEFLNAVAVKSDPHALWHPNMASAEFVDPVANGIPYPIFLKRIGQPGEYRYQVIAGQERKPVLYISVLEAMRFANWLHHGGGPGDTENGAYDIAKQGGLAVHEPGATVWIPTEDEWYKAAYFQPEAKGGPAGGYWLYPMRSNDEPKGPGPGDKEPNAANFWRNSFMGITPVGSYPNAASYYGTFDQGGNAWEWNEGIVFSSKRSMRGGGSAHPTEKLRSTVRSSASPGKRYPDTGFRLARALPKAVAAPSVEPTIPKQP